jgi:dihydroorotate dehydrogenase (fumarate)
MLSTNIGKLNIKTCIYNASGPLCTDYNELETLMNNPHTGIVLTKSCTLDMKIGNDLPRYYETYNSSINSTGLANLGYKKYLNFADKLTEKPYFMSVSGLSLEDNLKIITEINDNINVKGIELNLSCPNIIGKPQIGYDFDSIENILDNVFEKCDFNNNQLFGLKLPPYFDNIYFEKLADIFNKYPKINFLTCINSIGNGLIINDDTIAIKPNNGLGGLGGACIKPIALSNVHQFYKLLGNKIDIIGCGGVVDGQDVFEHILCGASAVQIGTQYIKDGDRCFKKISMELERIMATKGCVEINDFKGRLRYL